MWGNRKRVKVKNRTNLTLVCEEHEGEDDQREQTLKS